MLRTALHALALLFLPAAGPASGAPSVSYTLAVDTADLSGFSVSLRIRGAPDTFRLAMFAHPEYDDRFWRHLENITVDGGPAGAIVREDSAVWRVVAPGGNATVRYRIRLPTPQEWPRASWRPVLTPEGGLVGGPHAFLYLVGAIDQPSPVALELPASWDAATALRPSGRRRFTADDTEALVESPILVGRFRQWRFFVEGVPHRVVYWPSAAVTFDTMAFVGGVERLVRESVRLFGAMPYREYHFLFQDSAYGGLEHPNSVTLGARAAQLEEDPLAAMEGTAHEFVHTWNLMQLRPREYRGVDWRVQPPVAGLWWSEGLTIFYADLLRRRAGLPVEDSTRVAHLETLIHRYAENSAYGRFSAEEVSRVAYNAGNDALGGYSASAHLLGELIGTILDLVVRDATDGKRSMDDVMRRMVEKFGGERGFVGEDVETVTEEVCGCDVTPIFDAHVRGGRRIDFARWLGLAGLRLDLTREIARRQDGSAEPDYRIRAYTPGDGTLRLHVFDPASAWGRAGLRTDDRITAVDGRPVTSWPEFRNAITRVGVGDTVVVDVVRAGGVERTPVALTGWDRPVVRITPVANATPRQRALRERWLVGAP